MSIPTPNVAIYTENSVVTPTSQAALLKWATALPSSTQRTQYLKDSANAIQAADVATAGYDTIIVGLFHVQSDGSISYNDFPVDSDTSAAIAQGNSALKSSPGSTVKTVLISFGGGNWYGHPASVSDTDYPNMQANWSTFKPALITLLQACGADGVDWDYEPVTTPFVTSFIIQITNEIAAEPYLVTAAPYTDQSDWLTVIAGTVTGTSGNNFAWWNLQIYGGADYSDWVGAMQGATTGLSDSEVEAFLVPGYAPDCSPGESPVPILTAMLKSYPSLNGAFIWNYNGVIACAPAMATAITGVFT